jgi:hypothetical protein
MAVINSRINIRLGFIDGHLSYGRCVSFSCVELPICANKRNNINLNATAETW